MEELFRFSVLRAANRSNTSTISLENLTKRSDPKSFQNQLRYTIQNPTGGMIYGRDIWKNLENTALHFVLNQDHAKTILSNSLWTELQSFLETLQKQIENIIELDSTSKDNITNLFNELLTDDQVNARSSYQSDLSDLFIAFLVLRRGGPSNLNKIIRSSHPPLWESAEMLCDNPTLLQIADRIRAIQLFSDGPSPLIQPTQPGNLPITKEAIQDVFQSAMDKTLLLPHGIFASFEKPIHGVGFREFHVVKQHIRRYELSEISRIENILKGESRDHSQKHTLSNETDTFFQTDTTTETDKELSSTDQVNIKNEAENQIKLDTRIDAGVHAQYDGGSFKLQSDLTGSIDKSTDNSRKFASDISKEVTQKAASKVKQQITQSRTTKIIETFAESEDQSFDNSGGTDNISGIYQWVEKIYLAQTFNLGRHMVFDLMVPEPAASLLGLATIPAADQKPPVPPPPLKWISFPASSHKPSRLLEIDDDVDNLKRNEQAIIHNLQPEDLDPDQIDNNPVSSIPYTKWIGRYGVTGTSPSPDKFISVGKAISRNSKEDIAIEDEVRITEGYEAQTAYVALDWKHSAGDDEVGIVSVKVANKVVITAVEDAPQHDAVLAWHASSSSSGDSDQRSYFIEPHFSHLSDNVLFPIVGAVPIAISAPNIDQVSCNIEISCSRLLSLLRLWQLQTYEKIVAAWQKLQSDYESKIAALQFQKESVGPIGAADPLSNRFIERKELKRSCIAIIDNNNETVRGVGASSGVAVQPFPVPKPNDSGDPNYPQLFEPNLHTVQDVGARVRWFEQAFEWENMAYVFYPYFWGERSTWIKNLNLKTDDPLFLNFLQAGYARVVLPVRLGFEKAVHFYLHTGLPWMGGELPAIGDKTQNPLYLDIAEEIKAITSGIGTNEKEIPIGDPWEYILPTTIIKLRKDDTLPEWHRLNPTINNDPVYSSDEPVGPWSWKDGPPTP